MFLLLNVSALKKFFFHLITAKAFSAKCQRLLFPDLKCSVRVYRTVDHIQTPYCVFIFTSRACRASDQYLVILVVEEKKKKDGQERWEEDSHSSIHLHKHWPMKQNVAACFRGNNHVLMKAFITIVSHRISWHKTKIQCFYMRK